MTAKVNPRARDEIRFGGSNPSEATEADAEEYELGAPTTDEDNTPSVILSTMLEAPVDPPKKLKEIGREREAVVVDRPRPGGGNLILVDRGGTSPVTPQPVKGGKITVGDDSNIPESWKDYL